jgi:hypothetical protein
MYNVNVPPESELPSSRTLVKSTLIAAGVALVLLVTVVLLAEYGVDPTGFGRVTGLKRMGEIKMALAREAASSDAAANAATATADEAPAAAPDVAPVVAPAVAPAVASSPAATPATDSAARSDESRVTLAPGQAAEIKLAMRKGARVRYSWATDRGVLNFDMHADREVAPAIKYHNYAKGQGRASDEGELVAAFEGRHGWFWRNRGTEAVTVTLRTQGDYQDIKRLE